MRISDFKEIFFAFYARFVDLIALFGFMNSQKKSYFKRIINYKLKNKIINDIVFINFSTMITRFRQFDIEFKINDENVFKKKSNNNKREQKKFENRKFFLNKLSNTRGKSIFTENYIKNKKSFFAYRMFEYQIAQLKK